MAVTRFGPAYALRSLRNLPPVYFALVMATGIVSRGLLADGWPYASRVLLVIGLVAFVLLFAGTVYRLLRYRADTVEREVDPASSFAFFTVVAGANVLATRLAEYGYVRAAVGFLIVGSAAWVVLGYSLPALLVVRHGVRPALAGADGTWFLWVVGTQSIVVAITGLPEFEVGWLEPVAVAGWSVGLVLYLVVAALVLGRLLAFPVRPAQLTHSYWVFMGATAITALAGARILNWTSSPLIEAVTPVVAGFSVVFWAFGTWLVPWLIGASVWHERSRMPLVYEPSLWSIVFPVGMYGVASRSLGKALDVHWLDRLGVGADAAGAILWLLVLLGMLLSWGRTLVRLRHCDGSRTGSAAAR